MLCKSCYVPLSSVEMGDYITLEDGTKVPETFCRQCVKKYVDRVDDLDSREYQFEHITEHWSSDFTTYNE